MLFQQGIRRSLSINLRHDCFDLLLLNFIAKDRQNDGNVHSFLADDRNC